MNYFEGFGLRVTPECQINESQSCLVSSEDLHWGFLEDDITFKGGFESSLDFSVVEPTLSHTGVF